MSNPPRSRFLQRNQGAERVGQVLELLSLSHQPLPLQELSQRLGMHASTAHRLLKTMEEQELIARMDSTELYRLGPRILTLSMRMLNQYPVREVASPHLFRLSAELGFTTTLSSYSNGYITYLDCKDGPNPIGVVMRPGGRAPAHAVPSGRVQLAFLGEPEIDRLAERGFEPGQSGETFTLEGLKETFAQIRQRGYDLGGRWLPGVSGVAVPILDLNGTPIAAISVAGFASQFPDEVVPHLADSLQQAATAISQKMGNFRAGKPAALPL